jgi:PAS domain S-box-containing protein
MMGTTGSQVGEFIERRRVEEISLHLAAIVESSDDAIISKSLEGVILSWNKGAEQIFGYTADEVIGKSIYILIPPDRTDEEPKILDNLRRGQRIDHYETVRVRKDGRTVNISLTVSPIKDKSGKVIAASKIARDISEHKRMEAEREQLLAREQAAREQAERRWRESRLLASATRQFSSTLQLEDLLPTICRAAREIAAADGATFVLREGERVHYVEEDAITPLWKGNRFPITECISGWTMLEREPAYVEDIYADERVPIEAYQSTFVKSLAMVPVRGHDPIGAIGVYWARQRKADDREITLLEVLADAAHIAFVNTQLYEQTRAAREQAEQANRLKDEFLATVSHELRTPLNAMLGWTRMLRTGKLDEATYERALETIERNAKSQAQLIEDLLDVSRIVSGKMRLDVQPVELAPVIQSAVDSVRPAADAKAIRINMVLDPMAGPVSGDPIRLQQIVWNLLSNAIKFTPKGGRVQVRLERINSHIEITVSDTGMGISPDFLPYVFDRFRQADSTLTRKQPGLGLGLAIVRHLVELHGGNIQAFSAGAGAGATFTLKLPVMILRDPERFSTQVAERKHPTAWPDLVFECPAALEGLRVLVVDDEPDARRLLSAILSRCKSEVTAVASAGDALDALERLKLDVIVSDIEMPEEDGYSFIRKVRAIEGEQNGRIPAAALTAHAGVGDRLRALSAGFDIHVPKPVEPAELVAVIASLASRIKR